MFSRGRGWAGPVRRSARGRGWAGLAMTVGLLGLWAVAGATPDTATELHHDHRLTTDGSVDD